MEIDHYNLDMIISLGYRVQSPIAVRFRRWATQRLHEYIQKGFTMDDERLKQGGNRYFKELLQRIKLALNAMPSAAELVGTKSAKAHSPGQSESGTLGFDEHAGLRFCPYRA